MTQQEAFDILKLGHNVYLTGPAGSGKTFLLNKYIDYLKEHNKGVAITASTGIAATHMGGVTIHSWSGMGIKEYLTQDILQEILNKSYLKKRFLNTDVLIIDEISMLHAFQFDMLNTICQAFRENYSPFGGMQVVCSGDFFQLPPIQKKGNKEVIFVPKSQAWNSMDMKVCYLEDQYRHEDNELLLLLNYIRDNAPEQASNILQNSDVESTSIPDPVKLYTHNIDVDAINNRELDKIQEEEFDYYMRSKGKKKFVTALKKSCLAPQHLILKKGARVMFVKNSFDKGYVNGTLGEVVDFNDNDMPIIKTRERRLITPMYASWTIEDEGIVKAEINQLPIRLAWAITVHKSQGMTLDAAEVDLSKSFVEGMGYVALSRVKTLNGLKLLGINEMSFLVNQSVLEFDEELKQISQEVASLLKSKREKEIKQKQKQFLNSLSKQKKKESNKKEITTKTPKISTIEQTKILLKYKLSLKEMANVRNIKERTILSHLEKLIESGENINIEHLKPEKERFEQIKQAFEQLDTTKLAPVRELLGDDFSYEEIQLARLFLKTD